MNKMHGNIFWNEKVDIIHKYPYLSKNRKCDVLIIGGGIGGALTAYVQAKQGAKVIVAEKNILGYGTTLETNGVLEARVDFNNKIGKSLTDKQINKCNSLCADAIKEIENIINELKIDEECKKYMDKLEDRKLDLMYYSEKITGKINMFKTFEKLGKENKEIEYLEEDPLINLRTGIIFPDDAYFFNPYLLTELIFFYLSKFENVEIYENTPVVNIVPKDDVVESITSNKFKIYSRNVILTNGINALEYLKDDSITLNKTFTIITDACHELDENIIDVVGVDVNIPNTMISFTKDKRNIISSEDTNQTEKMVDEKYFYNFANGKYRKLFFDLKRLLNLKNDFKVTNCFSGRYLETKDSLPIIDEIDRMPNVYCNLTVGKNGIVHSMIGAKMLKDICKQYHVKDMYLFRENR